MQWWILSVASFEVLLHSTWFFRFLDFTYLASWFFIKKPLALDGLNLVESASPPSCIKIFLVLSELILVGLKRGVFDSTWAFRLEVWITRRAICLTLKFLVLHLKLIFLDLTCSFVFLLYEIDIDIILWAVLKFGSYTVKLLRFFHFYITLPAFLRLSMLFCWLFLCNLFILLFEFFHMILLLALHIWSLFLKFKILIYRHKIWFFCFFAVSHTLIVLVLDEDFMTFERRSW